MGRPRKPIQPIQDLPDAALAKDCTSWSRLRSADTSRPFAAQPQGEVWRQSDMASERSSMKPNLESIADLGHGAPTAAPTWANRSRGLGASECATYGRGGRPRKPLEQHINQIPKAERGGGGRRRKEQHRLALPCEYLYVAKEIGNDRCIQLCQNPPAWYYALACAAWARDTASPGPGGRRRL